MEGPFIEKVIRGYVSPYCYILPRYPRVAALRVITMKLLVLLLPLVALCSGAPKSLIPGDNSHYVEGVSRYIWMPDGDGVPHLVDLEEPVDEELLNSRNGANNQYWLYTRRNPTSSQIITNGNANSVRNSNYNGNRPLKVVVHGWNSNGNSQVNPLVTAAFLAVQDCNVIVVDWRQLANSNYVTAANGVRGIGERNPNNAQILRNGNADSVTNSNYDRNRPLKVIVHGWNSNGNSNMNPIITSAFLAVQDYNVIVVSRTKN
ncbi:Pancreatic lipase-related protein 1 [Papilio machaon]|uniref:Pancreatic lipase-related protein 1 n=1 Tax=Papilio machaon TaxID=76193 RepID=A0A0N1IQA3_PAPMA|nr:Pancreatic lipase-related protein 1 [Papilio machaon]